MLPPMVTSSAPADYRAIATRLERVASRIPDPAERAQLEESVRLLRHLADELPPRDRPTE